MRIAGEIMLDRTPQGATSFDVLPDDVAEQIRDQFLPPPGTKVRIHTDRGVAEYVVTSAGTWHEDMRPEMQPREMSTDPTSARTHRGQHTSAER